MISINPEEKIIKIVRKHWFTLVPFGIMLFLLMLLPTLLPLSSETFPIAISHDTAAPLAGFAVSIYLLILSIIAFAIWIDYYLDVWIITNTRIIDVEQHGLFNREISEIPRARIQDVTIEVRGIIRTLLRFGTIRIQTAGEREFTINNIPHLEEIKEIIFKQISWRRDQGSEKDFTGP